MFLCSFNKGVSALNYIQHQRIQFVAQAVPHQCIAHHGAEHRAAAAAEKTRRPAVPGVPGENYGPNCLSIKQFVVHRY